MKRLFLLLVVILSVALSFCKKKNNNQPVSAAPTDSTIVPSYPTDTFSGISNILRYNAYGWLMDSTIRTNMTVSYLSDRRLLVSGAIISGDEFQYCCGPYGYRDQYNVFNYSETYLPDSSDATHWYVNDILGHSLYLRSDSLMLSGNISYGCATWV